MIRWLSLAGMLLLLLAGCGKKGALVPPEALVPAPVTDLRVTQRGESFLLSWTRPSTEEGGGRVKNLAGFRVLRREVLPPGQDCEQCPDAYRLLRTVDLDYLKGAARLGERYFISDSDLGTGAAYQYKVVSFTADGGASRDSNKPVRRKIDPPPAPALSLSPLPGGIELSWTLPPLPQGVTLAGYNVYRRAAGRPFGPVPLNDRPLQTFRFEDRRLDPALSYTYMVTTVIDGEGEGAESAPSNEVTGSLSTLPR